MTVASLIGVLVDSQKPQCSELVEPPVLQSYLRMILGDLEPGFLSKIMGMNMSRMLHFSTGTFTRDLEGRERYDVRLIWRSH